MNGDGYPPIADYGLIGGLQSCALVSSRGSIDWCCLPRFDSPSVFGRLLDRERGGFFEVTAPGARRVHRRYLPGTTALETTFQTDGGVAVLTDFFPPPAAGAGVGVGAADPPRIVRRLRCVEGSMGFHLSCVPRFDYAAGTPVIDLLGSHAARAQSGSKALALHCSAPLRAADATLQAEGTLRAGEVLRTELVWQPSPESFPAPEDGAGQDRDLERCVAWWQDWAGRCRYTEPDRPAVVRSAVTLKALTFAPSGAVVAAPTTSLPESPGGALNWDYRYSWPRDSAVGLLALLRLGRRGEARAYLDFMARTLPADGRLPVLQGVAGERPPAEREPHSLTGYDGARPVRIGNAAADQFQLDIGGEVMALVSAYHDGGGVLGVAQREAVRAIANFTAARWQEPDEGIWESRAGRAHHVCSKVMCWAALDRAIALIPPDDPDRVVWQAARAEIRAEVLDRGLDAERGFVQTYDNRAPDAANLLIPLVGFLPPSDPRIVATVDTIARELRDGDGLVYRNRMHGPTGTEGTFVVCSYWMVENLALRGEIEGARRLFEQVNSFTNDLGLLSEEIDSAEGTLWGNFPQLFSHAGHISAAVTLAARPQAPAET